MTKSRGELLQVDQARLSDIRASADKLFTEWEARQRRSTDADLKEHSEERRAELAKSLEKVMKASRSVMEETKSFVTANTDLMTYLSQDLTPDGIEAVASKAKAQTKAANSINEEIDTLVEAAAEASSEFATAKPPAK